MVKGIMVKKNIIMASFLVGMLSSYHTTFCTATMASDFSRVIHKIIAQSGGFLSHIRSINLNNLDSKEKFIVGSFGCVIV
jgi:hypothetical protein